MPKVYKGHFQQISTEEFPSFVHLNGDMELNIDISSHPDVPLETVLEAKFRGPKLISWKRDPSVAFDIPSGIIDIACAFVTRLGEEPEDDEIEDHKKDCAKLQNELRRISAGRWKVKVTPYFYQTDSGFSLEGFDYRGLREFLNDINPDNRHNYWGASGGWSTGFCGKAPIGGRYFWAYPNCGADTKIHEWFHNRGLHHAGTPSYEYGEGKVWMGNSNIRDTLNAPQMYRIELLDPEYVKILDRYQGAEIHLQVADTYPLAMLDNTHKLVICKTGSMTTKRVAISYNDGTVDVHKPGNDGSIVFGKTTLLASLEEPDDSFLVAGVRITLKETSHSGNAVTVLVANDTDSIELADPAEMVLPDEAYPIFGQNGIWRNPAWSAQGVHVRYLPDRSECFMAWLTWDNDMNQEWYWSVADVENNIATGTLLTLGTDGTLIEKGICHLYFYDMDSGIFRASMYGKGCFAMPLERLSEAIESRYNGFWGMGNQNGLSLEAVDVSEEFDYQRAVGYYLQNDGRWSLVEGPLGEDLTIYSITGGGRGIKADVVIKATGTLTNEGVKNGVALA